MRLIDSLHPFLICHLNFLLLFHRLTSKLQYKLFLLDYPNNNYIPFAYYKTDDNVWHTRPDDPKYTKLYDISSVYDGDPDNLEADAYCADSDNVLGV